jgi:hypothetical protein
VTFAAFPALATTTIIGVASVAGGGVATTPPGSEPHASPPSSVAGSTTAGDVADLDAVLIGADVLDVPADWLITDIDPTLTAEQLAEFDPFLGLLSCPEGTLREGADRQWLGRRFSAPELPLENGLLSVELIVEVESDEQWAEDRAALDDCETGEQAVVTVTDTESVSDPQVDPTGTAPNTAAATTLPMTRVELLSSATSAVPYPSAIDAGLVHVDDRTVIVILGGVDMGESYQPLVEDIAAVVTESVQSTSDET